MSKFSDKCRELLVENGTNVYRLSISAAMERTKLQRMVTGKRLPNIEFVRRFCRELRMPVQEEEQLLELYKREIVGEDVYRNRQCIRDLFRRLSSLEQSNYREIPETLGGTCVFQENETALDSFFSVYVLLEQCFLSKEPVHILTNFPASDKEFFRQLSLLHYKYKGNKVSVSHLIHFQINTMLSFLNLQVLHSILPLALSNTLDYTAYYYYSKTSESDFSQLLFPYYVITENFVLEISGDLKNCILHTDGERIKAYTQEFQRILSLSKPLIQCSDTPESAWEQYKQRSPEEAPMTQVLEAQPCYRDLISDEEFLKVIEDKASDFLPMAKGMLRDSKALHSREGEMFFTENGLDYFCRTGKITGQVATLLPPLTLNQRIEALERFLQRDSIHRYYCISSEKLPLPLNLNFEIYGNKQFQLIQVEPSLKVSLFTITESSICEAFYDFAGSLRESGLVLGEEETNELVRAKVEGMKLGKLCK